MSAKKQYKIGISFSNNYRRKYVEPLAEALLDLGFYKEEIFYYPWHEASINGPDGDIALQEIYNEKCKLIVVLLSTDYSKKVWAGHIEWPAVRDVINRGGAKKVCLLQVGDVDVSKIPGLHIGVALTKAIDELSAEDVASFVAEKYHHVYPKDDDISTSVDLVRMKKQNEFLSKISELTEKDGMMRCMYQLFMENLADKRISLSDISLLSIVQSAYQKLYDEYDQTEKVSDTRVFDNLLASKPVADMEKMRNVHQLILSYLHFVKADRAYFEKKYAEAIKEYKQAYDEMQNKKQADQLSDVEKQTCVYLLNSIAWSIKEQGEKESITKAIQVYEELFTKYPETDKYYFAWKYRRNYGVCLERDGQYVKAMEQYECGLSDYKSIDGSLKSNEYKIYITYCTAMMKYWDLRTGKTSGKWIANIQEQYCRKQYFLTDEIFCRIDSRLELFHSAITGHNVPNKYPDYYNQKSKMLTYRMIISQDKDERKRIAYEIMKNLYTLEVVTRKGKGWRFVKRDFYYAQFELADDLEEKKAFLSIACKENDELPRNDETKKFHDLLETKKSEIFALSESDENNHFD